MCSISRIIILITMTLFLFLQLKDADANDRGFINYDGDTFRATFRVAGVDTPEIKGKCEYERKLAEEARNYTMKFLSGNEVTITKVGVDKYGRVLAKVFNKNESLADALIKNGLGRPWKGRREQWCP